jgi:hypothetical protein
MQLEWSAAKKDPPHESHPENVHEKLLQERLLRKQIFAFHLPPVFAAFVNGTSRNDGLDMRMVFQPATVGM